MLVVSKEFEFCAAHYLPGHEKCGQMHGHNYKVVVGFRGDDSNDMVVDFGDIKQSMELILNKLDHRNLNELFYEPTAENIAKSIFNHMRSSSHPLIVRRLFFVDVWETPTSCARCIE